MYAVFGSGWPYLEQTMWTVQSFIYCPKRAPLVDDRNQSWDPLTDAVWWGVCATLVSGLVSWACPWSVVGLTRTHTKLQDGVYVCMVVVSMSTVLVCQVVCNRLYLIT